jgi:GNAT superfamily N-acetyltransferase
VSTINVYSAELSQRRIQMGMSIQPWIPANGLRAIGEVTSDYWVVLTGSPGPDGNMALVHDGTQSTLEMVQKRLNAEGYPCLLMLAGYPVPYRLTPPWQSLGRLPFMFLHLPRAQFGPDARVRRANDEDFETVVQLVTDSNPFGREVAEVGVAILREEVESPIIWLLHDNGIPVSTVSSAVVEDAVCIWSMATPPRYRKRGYGRALLSHALHHAYVSRSAVLGLLAASPAGKPLYEATGWSVVEEWQMYMSPGRMEEGST